MEVIRTLLPTDWHCAAYTEEVSCEETDCIWDGSSCDTSAGPPVTIGTTTRLIGGCTMKGGAAFK
jgi:hypothetical protein